MALVYATRPPPILASGQPDPFTVGTAILLVGYFLFPVLALFTAALLLVALLLLGARLIDSRRTDGTPESRRDSRAQLVPIPLGAALLGGLYLAFMTLRAGDSMHIDVTPYSTAFAFFAGLAIAAGVVIVLRVREIAVGARFGIAIGGLVFGVSPSSASAC